MTWTTCFSNYHRITKAKLQENNFLLSFIDKLFMNVKMLLWTGNWAPLQPSRREPSGPVRPIENQATDSTHAPNRETLDYKKSFTENKSSVKSGLAVISL